MEDLQDPYVPTDDEAYVELVGKREESTKYYLLESKRYEAVKFGVPVHYLDNGAYKDIDNSLILETDKDGNSYYTNKANSVQAFFAASTNEGWSAGISKDGYEMKWKLDGTEKGVSAVQATQLTRENWSELGKGEQRRNLPNLSSTVTYANAMPNTYLDYQLNSKTIKENIVVTAYTGNNVFVQTISVNGVELIQKEDGSIVAVDGADFEKEVFYFMTPYAMIIKAMTHGIYMFYLKKTRKARVYTKERRKRIR